MTALGVVLIALGLAGAFVGRSPLGALNFVVLQWFGVRLARRMLTEQHDLDITHVSLMPGGGFSVGGRCATREVQRGWMWLRWVWPMTGWWSPYRWIARRPKTVGDLFPRLPKVRLRVLDRVTKQLRRVNRRLRRMTRR